MTYRITRRQALADALAAAGTALLATGCSSTGTQRIPTTTGSTLQSTWVDPLGIGILKTRTRRATQPPGPTSLPKRR